MVRNFEQQRAELLGPINSPEFIDQFFGDYRSLEEAIHDMRCTLERRNLQRQQFQAWREMGETIEGEFKELAC
jgi:hypothetical protein